MRKAIRHEHVTEIRYDPERYTKMWQQRANKEFWRDVKTFCIMVILGAGVWAATIWIFWWVMIGG